MSISKEVEQTNTHGEITDEEDSLAKALYREYVDTYNLTPVELTLGPLQGDINQTIYESFRLKPDKFDDFKEYYDAVLFKLHLKTSLYISVNGYRKGSSKGVVYKTLLGIGDKMKLEAPFADRPLLDSVDYLEYDTYYVFAFLEDEASYSLSFSFFLSNEKLELDRIYKIVGIIGGVFLGICICCCGVFVCCNPKKRQEEEFQSNGCLNSCCNFLCCGCVKSKKKKSKFRITTSPNNRLMSANQLGRGGHGQGTRDPVEEDPLNITWDRTLGPMSDKNIITLPPRRHPATNSGFRRDSTFGRQGLGNGTLPYIPERTSSNQ